MGVRCCTRVVVKKVTSCSSEPSKDDFVLTLMTDDLQEARAGVAAGVQRIGPDLETFGKQARQGGLGTRLSLHDPAILDALRPEREESALFARVDPMHDGSRALVEDVLRRGAQVLMLPFFHDWPEVDAFVRLVDGRARTVLLVETASALFRLPAILRVPGIDEVHFGLTDLMLSTGMNSRFEILASDLFAASCAQVTDRGIPMHIAGVAALGDRQLPISCDLTLARYAELGAMGSLITRHFVNFVGTGDAFEQEVSDLKDRFAYWRCAGVSARNQALGALRGTIADLKSAGKMPP